jgi:energy-coupling factor transporter ATP-binding protein EcfA2
MVEALTHLSMQAFRGVPERFELDLDGGRSCVIYGENASGKSTISDAIEWYFTHRIKFLSLEGRGQGIRNFAAPEKLTTTVEVETTGDCSGSVTLNDHPPSQALLLGRRETFLLRGQTITDFVNKRKGEKWEELVEILGLRNASTLRQDLKRARTELKRRSDDTEAELSARTATLGERVEDTSQTGVLATLREAAGALGVETPATLADVADPEWVARRLPTSETVQREVKLEQLSSNLTAAQAVTVDLGPLNIWNEERSDEDRNLHLRLQLYETADQLLAINEAVDQCPLCQQSVDDVEFRDLVSESLEALRAASQEFDSARTSCRDAVHVLQRVHDLRQQLSHDAAKLNVELPTLPNSPTTEVEEAVGSARHIDVESVAGYLEQLNEWDQRVTQILGEARTPQAGGMQDVVDFQTLVSDTVTWLETRRQRDKARAAHQLAQRIEDAYKSRFHKYVDSILEQISDEVSHLYGHLHPHGGLGKVSLGTWGSGVELRVEYFGQAHRPPHRVLSESHLNSLGLALFLAMARVFNERAGFVVLDDVINSFDIDHRGALADMLTDELSDLQLIVLTHDPQFYARLTKRQPSWKRVEFIGWTYAQGPHIKAYTGDRLLSQAREQLENGDLIGAAQKSRRALEELLREACEQLEAPLAFRRGTANDLRDATELLKGVRREWKRGPDDYRDEFKERFKALEVDLQAALNVEVHAGEQHASLAEVGAALDRIEELQSRWTCFSCDTRIWHSGNADRSSCRCGHLQHPSIPDAPDQAS